MPAFLFLAALAATDGSLEDRDLAYRSALAGDLEEAQTLYESLVARGYDGADLWFNLGTVALERGDLVKAVVSLRSALRRDPGHPGARQNLEVVRARAGTTVSEPEPRLLDALRPVYASVGFLGGVALLCAANLAWALWLGLRLARSSASPRRLAAVGGAGLATGALLILGCHHWVAHEPWVAVQSAARLLEGPAPRFKGISELPAATELLEVDAQGPFIEVRTRDGRTGWVRREATLPVPAYKIWGK
ncbi:MAG: tetratricopeptide repeat protein [Myxococcota bacterium]